MSEINSPLWRTRDFFLGFVGQTPIYYEGTKIGYWTNLQDLCNGKIFVYQGYKGTDASKWITTDFFGRTVSVTSFCVGKGIRPNWISETEYKTAQITPPVPIVNPADPSFKELALKYGTLAGLGVLTLIVLTRR